MENYTIQDEAARIFRSVLLTDSRLGIPDEVREAAERTSFDPRALSKPFLPAPVKCTESSAALVSNMSRIIPFLPTLLGSDSRKSFSCQMCHAWDLRAIVADLTEKWKIN